MERGELRGIIGPNGAGKSTLFNLVAGHLRPNSGRVLLEEEPVHRLPSHERARRGIAIVYQGARIFRGMSVLENVMVGAHRRWHHGFLQAALQTRRCRRENSAARDLAASLLETVGLGGLGHQPAESLPLGQQRAMQLARAMAADPAVLLLDEPAAGLRDAERRHLADLIVKLRERGLTVLLVEHDVPLVMHLSDKITVLDLGRVIAEGSPSEIRADQVVVDAYLGSS